MYKLTKYHHLTIIISILLICYLIIPMTPLDTISYLRYDARWWYNQYIEFKQSFPNINPVAFTGFNNSGLIINQFYPNNTLRLLEIPMILFNVESPQLVIGILTLMTSILSSIGIYLNVKALEIKHTIFHTAVFTTILLSAQNSGPLNSVTQNLGIAIMLFAVYGIYSRKYCHSYVIGIRLWPSTNLTNTHVIKALKSVNHLRFFFICKPLKQYLKKILIILKAHKCPYLSTKS